MRVSTAAVLLLAALSCRPTPPAVYGETAEWREWRGTAGIGLPTPAAAPKVDCTIDFDIGDRPCKPEDWIEVIYNGDILGRRYIHVPEGQPPKILRVELKLMTGDLNRFCFFDTVTNKGYKFMLNTRTPNGHAGRFVFYQDDNGVFQYSQSE